MQQFSARRKWLLSSLCGCMMLADARADVNSFNDLQFWVGSGPNRAALIIDWSETPDRTPLAWGFRWSGTATGEDMFRAVVRRDPRLYGRIGTAGAFGVPLYGIGYDRDGDGFALSDGTPFTNGLAVTGPSDGAVAVDPDDSYNEGWNTGFWAYYVGAGNPYAGGSWASPPVGFGDRQLTHGDWDGFSFAPGFLGNPPEPAQAARHSRAKLMAMTIPEPPLSGAWIVIYLALSVGCLRSALDVPPRVGVRRGPPTPRVFGAGLRPRRERSRW